MHSRKIHVSRYPDTAIFKFGNDYLFQLVFYITNVFRMFCIILLLCFTIYHGTYRSTDYRSYRNCNVKVTVPVVP
eukprot:SAG11_NODE_9_length_28972_cov_81.532539_2_plen_75_part_00